MRLWRNLVIMALALPLLAACGSSDKPPYPGVKIGKPYQIYGRWYKPKYEPDYDEIGMASWYGPGFHGGKTANGERYDQHDYTAAHRTLPLPSIVRVTNLRNGKSILVKINDRGPFSRDRIIDLSQSSASALGMIATGTAKVRVQFLEKETKEYIADSNASGMHYAMEKVRGVNPEVASAQQEERGKPTFYVMKVPAGRTPPADAVQVSEADAVKYPAGDIFAVADQDPTAQEDAAREPARNEQRYVAYLDDANNRYERKGAVVNANYISQEHAGALAALSSLYYVQAGTFGVEDNASRLAERLRNYHSKVVSMKSGKAERYRVLVGPYRQADEARNMVRTLASIGVPAGTIVRE